MPRSQPNPKPTYSPDLDISGEMPDPLTSVEEWWMDTALVDKDKTTPKAAEYGGYDMVMIGRDMCELAGTPPPEGVNANQWYAEVGTYFYIVGKMARWHEAIKQGRLVSDDTLLDITVYSMMQRRIRATGAWG